MAYHFTVCVENLYDDIFLLKSPFRPRTPSAINISSDYIPGQDTPYLPGSHTHSSFIAQQPLSSASPSPTPLSTSTENFRRNLRSFTTNSAPQTSSESLHTYRTQRHLHAPIAHYPHPPHIPCFRAKTTHTDIKCSSCKRTATKPTLTYNTRVLLELPRSPRSGRCCAPSLLTQHEQHQA